MKTLICNFSGYKIYPGHGKRYVRGDSKTFNFLDNKSAALFLKKKNPRKIHWTVVYRRVHKKGIVEEEKRKRSRKNRKMQRDIVGASLAMIRMKQNQKPEVRAAQREKALRAVKEQKRKAQATKSEAKAKSSQQKVAQRQQQKAQKPKGKAAAPKQKAQKGGKR